MKILAAVVTHNRCKLLERCIDGIQAQSSLPDSILVINNGSTDQTERMLDQKNIQYITQENVGSAGGWNRALEFAVDNEYDACWLMDDDGFPDSEALQNLKKNFSEEFSCISSIVVNEESPDFFVFPMPVLNSLGLPKIFGIPRKFNKFKKLKDFINDNLYPFAHLFNGALISISAVNKVGNINKEFFLMGDEVDYFFRLRQAGKVLSCLEALHFHPDVTKREFNAVKIYFYIKNSIILNKRYFNNIFLRNMLVIVAIIVRVFLRNGFLAMLSMLCGRNAKLFYKAILRGLQGKIGNDIYS